MTTKSTLRPCTLAEALRILLARHWTMLSFAERTELEEASSSLSPIDNVREALVVARGAIDRLHDVATGKEIGSPDEIAYIINNAKAVIDAALQQDTKEKE